MRYIRQHFENQKYNCLSDNEKNIRNLLVIKRTGFLLEFNLVKMRAGNDNREIKTRFPLSQE